MLTLLAMAKLESKLESSKTKQKKLILQRFHSPTFASQFMKGMWQVQNGFSIYFGEHWARNQLSSVPSYFYQNDQTQELLLVC